MKIVNMKKQKPLSLEAEKHLFTGLLLFSFFFLFPIDASCVPQQVSLEKSVSNK